MPTSSSDSEGTGERTPRRRTSTRTTNSARRPSTRARRAPSEDVEETVAPVSADDFGSGVENEERAARQRREPQQDREPIAEPAAEIALRPERAPRERIGRRPPRETPVRPEESSATGAESSGDEGRTARGDRTSDRFERQIADVESQTGMRYFSTDELDFGDDDGPASAPPRSRTESDDNRGAADERRSPRGPGPGRGRGRGGYSQDRPSSRDRVAPQEGTDSGERTRSDGRGYDDERSVSDEQGDFDDRIDAEAGGFIEGDGVGSDIDGGGPRNEGENPDGDGGDRYPRRRRRRRRRLPGEGPVGPDNGVRNDGPRYPSGHRYESGRPEGSRPEGSRPENGRIESNRTDGGRGDGSRQESGRFEGNRPEGTRYEGSRPEGGRGRRGGTSSSRNIGNTGGGRGRRPDSQGRGGSQSRDLGGRSRGGDRDRDRDRGMPRRGRPIQPSGEVVEGTFEGVLELHPRGYGFLREPKKNYVAEDSNPFVSSSLVEKYQLREGVLIRGDVGQGTRNQGPRLREVELIDGFTPDEYANVKHFDTLTAINPFEQIKLEVGPRPVTMRVMDLLCPIGKGQRALLVAPPRTGKTMLLQDIANSVSINHPEIYLMVLLIDERPEEVTEMRRNVHGEVISSSLDNDVESHVRISQLIIERAKRLAEEGKDVFILLDSITRLARAFNKWSNTGRTATGGLDIRALDVPKKLFGQARRFDEGGSLTVCGTALIDTGSRMDEAIFQEFKGTGNMEMVLSRDLADRRIWPSIDIGKSGTRREEKIIATDLLEGITMLRRSLISLNPVEAMEQLTKTMEKFPTNREFLSRIKAVL